MAIQIPNQVSVHVSHDFSNTPTPHGLANSTTLMLGQGNARMMNIIGGMRARTMIAAQLLGGLDIDDHLSNADIAKALRLADKILAQDHREAAFRNRLWECRSRAEFDRVAAEIRGEMEQHELPSLDQWIKDFVAQKPELKEQAA